MTQRDLHQALRTDTLAQQQIQGAEFLLVRLQDSKTDIAHSLHVRVMEESIGALLFYLGFKRSRCSFTIDEFCFATELDVSLPLETFIGAFSQALGHFREARQKLGELLDPSARRPRVGNAHPGPESKFLKGIDEAGFRFALTWMETSEAVGWVRHVKIPAALTYDAEHLLADVMKLEAFETCPHFDFEPCFWAVTPHSSHVNPSVSMIVHGSFDRLPFDFPAGLAALAATEDAMLPVGMQFPVSAIRTFKSFAKLAEKMVAAPATVPPRKEKKDDMDFDVAISFAGAQRRIAEELARLATAQGICVFYDKDHAAELWGEDLTVKLDEIYREKARFCVPIVSREYAEREWPRWELRSARARALREKGAYILPLRAEEGVALEGVPETIGYISLKEFSLDEVIGLLLKKLGRGVLSPSDPVPAPGATGRSATDIRPDLVWDAFRYFKVVKAGHGLPLQSLLGKFAEQGLNGHDLLTTIDAMQRDGSVSYDARKHRVSRLSEE